MDKALVFPGRYYCRYPFENPRGYQFEEQVLDVDKTAFFLIDVYGKGFSKGEPEPEFPPLGHKSLFYKEREMIQTKIKPALDAARAAGLRVVYVTNYWPKMDWDESEFGKLVYRAETGWLGTLEKVEGGDSEFVEFSEIIAPQDGDYVVRKQMYDGFFETPLDSLFHNLGVKNLVCVGFSADICLLNTVIGAMYRNYRVILLKDCTLAAEFIDTLEDMRMTWFGIRYVEALVGFTTTSDVFMEACDKLVRS